MVASGTLLSKTAEKAHKVLEEKFANNCQWLDERLMAKKLAGIHEVDPTMSFLAQVSTLVNQIASFTTRDTASRESAMVASSSSYSGDGVGLDAEQCQFINNRNYNYQPNNNLPSHYHPSLRNHENFSYANQRNALQPPPGYSQLLAGKKPTCEELSITFIMETRERFSKYEAHLDSIETHCIKMSATMKSMETQVGQLANELKNQQKGRFPNDTEQNPRDRCKAITLRSEKEVESLR